MRACPSVKQIRNSISGQSQLHLNLLLKTTHCFGKSTYLLNSRDDVALHLSSTYMYVHTTLLFSTYIHVHTKLLSSTCIYVHTKVLSLVYAHSLHIVRNIHVQFLYPTVHIHDLASILLFFNFLERLLQVFSVMYHKLHFTLHFTDIIWQQRTKVFISTHCLCKSGTVLILKRHYWEK